MKGDRYAVAYAAVLALVCAGLLTAAHQGLAGRIDANRDAARKRKILAALTVPLPEDASARDLLAAYDEKVRTETLGEMTFYVYGDREVWGTPFSGRGLWGPIEGFLALDADLRTIRGITFYRHEETPGLGGEISAKWFQRQFEGRTFDRPDGDIGIRIVRRGKAEKPWEVDTITGATMTAEKVERMVNQTLRRIAAVREQTSTTEDTENGGAR